MRRRRRACLPPTTLRGHRARSRAWTELGALTASSARIEARKIASDG